LFCADRAADEIQANGQHIALPSALVGLDGRAQLRTTRKIDFIS
jgi:hypothetical protein